MMNRSKNLQKQELLKIQNKNLEKAINENNIYIDSLPLITIKKQNELVSYLLKNKVIVYYNTTNGYLFNITVNNNGDIENDNMIFNKKQEKKLYERYRRILLKEYLKINNNYKHFKFKHYE